VDAHEVEAVLRAHPAVREACVVGLRDERWGEVVGAALVLAGAEVDVDALAEWLRERLSAAKRPRRWLVVAALPLNANGKVDRGAVRRGMLGG
jgi:acyl-CoA synthetase (AMP-forming)/AMP-acid ligase II